MAKDLSKMRAATLGRYLVGFTAKRLAASDAVFALAAHDQERYMDIITRLGTSHPAVKAYVAALEAEQAPLQECYRRYGPAVTYDSLWPTFLATYSTKPTWRG